MKEKKTMCGICPSSCGVVVSYDAGGRIVKVRPDESSPRGAICKLGEHSPEIIYSKHRLKYPMKRKGPKGAFDFERISWDEAYDIIVNNLNEIKENYGPEAAAIYTGRGSFDLALCDVYQPKDVAISSASSVLFPYGSPNTLGVGALCYVSFAMIAPHVTMGGMWHYMFSDIDNAELIVVWGANPASDSPPRSLEQIIKAKNRGAEVIVIDPRKTITAKATGADWISIRPGTDGALALGICNIMIEDEIYDDEFVKNWTVGFGDFSSYVQHFRPEVVENITGVPAGKVRDLAYKITEANGASPVMYTGLEYSDSGVQAIRATMVLWAIAGQLDVPGGRCFTMRENHFSVNRSGLQPNPDIKKALGRDRFPVYSSYRGESHAISLPESVIDGKPYKVRSLIILGGSIITSWPQPEIWRKTFENLDFMVSIDRQLTADCAYADIVLPATTMYEIDSYQIFGPEFCIREKAIEPVGEARNDFFILSELADRLGYGELYPQDHDQLLEYVLEGSGFTADDLRRNGGSVRKGTVMMQYKKWEKGLLRDDREPGFDTPSGKFEIASSILEEHGYDALPVYTEPKEGPLANPALARKFPLIFNNGSRVRTDFRSQHHGIEGLIKERPEPTVTMNTKDAKERGIANGDRVVVRSPRGKVKMRALVTDDIVRGSVDANMGGGGPVGPEAWQECNINELTDINNIDPISGFPVYKTLLCEIFKYDGSEDKVIIGTGETEIDVDGVSEEETYVERIYLDHNATTPVDAKVYEAMKPFLNDDYGNPSAIYSEGRNASSAVESSRRKIAQLLNCTARRIIFTGCGSEANNMAIKGTAFRNWNGNNHIITSSIEHPSVLNTCKWLQKIGFDVTFLPVDEAGMINPADVEKSITDKTCLVSIMTANNETGTIQPVREISEISRGYHVLFHTDAVQAAGKIPLDVEELGADMLTLSAHKIYGPKGVGALYLRKGIEPENLIHGGSQEHKMRSGTENTAGIIGFGMAAELAESRLGEYKKLAELRDMLERSIRESVPEAKLNGHPGKRLPNTLNMTLPGLRGESLVLAMDQKGISLSSGSACKAGSPNPSHALLALGLSEEDVHCSVRFSLGKDNTQEEIIRSGEKIREILRDIKETVTFVSCR